MMKRITLYLITISGLLLTALTNSSSGAPPAGCAVAGVADAMSDSICDNGATTLTLTGYAGNIQWQSFNGVAWVNETGPGSTTDTYNITPIATTDYRAYVTDIGCPDDSSNVVTVTVGIISPPSGTGASRCGYGQVTLSASGIGTLRWWDAASNGNLVDTGNTITPTVFNTTTYYVESTSGGGNVAPLTTTFAGGNGFDGNMFDIEAINQVTITSFDGNFLNTSGTAEIWYRVGSYLGFELDSAGWTHIGSAFLASTNGNGVGTPIPIPVNITIPVGQKYAFYVHFSGSVDYTNGIGNNLTITASDANINVFEGVGGAYFNLVNSPRIFNGTIYYEAGCASTRTPIIATVIPADTVSATATSYALCMGDNTTLSVTSANANYNYTWSPATGLSATTGASVTATPLAPVTYVVIGDDGTCADVDSITIDVGPTSAAGTAFTVSDTVCFGNTTIMTLTGSTGNIQWQSNDGSGWVNETNPGFDSTVYTFNPTQTKTYRAYVVSGGCPPDSSNILSITVVSINAPTTVDSSRCGPGIVPLSASGNGTLNWYTDSVGGTLVNTGTTYNANVTNTTTFWVENSAGGGIMHVGPPNASIGSLSYDPGNDWGIQFDVSQTITIEKVYMYPGTSGTITVNLRQTLGGPILNSASMVVQFAGITAVPLNFQVSPGTNYRLELANTSPQCEYNTNGAVWPYTSPGVPVTLTANLTPNQNTGGVYYFFYDWEITAGCKSIRVPATATVDSMPATPVINANGNILSSSSATGNQWYLNGNIMPGETNQNLVAAQPGTYTVTVTYNGCTATSAAFTYTSAGEVDGSSLSWNIYPNPGREIFNVMVNIKGVKQMEMRIMDAPGKLVYSRILDGPAGLSHRVDLGSLAAGVYLIELNVDGVKGYKKLIIDK